MGEEALTEWIPPSVENGLTLGRSNCCSCCSSSNTLRWRHPNLEEWRRARSSSSEYRSPAISLRLSADQRVFSLPAPRSCTSRTKASQHVVDGHRSDVLAGHRHSEPRTCSPCRTQNASACRRCWQLGSSCTVRCPSAGKSSSDFGLRRKTTV